MLAGKPLIAYTVEASLKSEKLARVIVSTDDDEIARIAKQFGAEVPFRRPPELATDTTSTEPVLIHALRWLEDNEGTKPDMVVLLQPTSPLRNAEHIDQSINLFLKGKYDSLFSACPSHSFIWRLKDDGMVHPINYDYQERPRKQEKRDEYRENGAIYITKYDLLINNECRLGGKIGVYVMSEVDSIEIDNPFDLWIAEQILKYKMVKEDEVQEEISSRR